MSKLTLDALKERAEAIASVDLLNSISGGTENSCHQTPDSDAISLNQLFATWDDIVAGDPGTFGN